jgi:hypothetical protein
MQKHKLRVTCPGALLMETAPGPPEHEKYCVDISCPGHPGVHILTQQCYWMQKHKCVVTCPGALFMKTESGPPEHKK